MSVRWLPNQRMYTETIPWSLQQAYLPAPTQLNYDAQKPFIARPRVSGLSFMAGLNQLGWQQSFHQAYLPPMEPVGVNLRVRDVGGVFGAGTISQSTVHIPSVLVPASVG
jgi:hypothetical protein